MRIYRAIRRNRRGPDHLRKRWQVVAIYLGDHCVNRFEFAGNLAPVRFQGVAQPFAISRLGPDDDRLLSSGTSLLNIVLQRCIEFAMAAFLTPDSFGPWKRDG